MIYVKLTSENLLSTLKTASEELNKGGIIAYPTETFYALGVKYDDNKALERLYVTKKRSVDMPFPLIVGDKGDVDKLILKKNKIEQSLMDKYWPGPLTIVFSARENISDFLASKKGKVAIRVPGESFALALVRNIGFPITATSANPTGLGPPCEASLVYEYFGKAIDMIVDGGPTEGRMPSTIIEVINKEIKIIRNGAIKVEQ